MLFFKKPRMDADTRKYKFCFYPCSSALIRGSFFVRFSSEDLYTSARRCFKAAIAAFAPQKWRSFPAGEYCFGQEAHYVSDASSVSFVKC